jgi:hypothetical protein
VMSDIAIVVLAARGEHQQDEREAHR